MLLNEIKGIDNNTAASQPLTGSQRVLGKEDFLRLLATQLSYQNPLEPVADTAFIAQLAEFSSLEQMQNANANLETIAILTQSLNNALATNLVGKDVKIAGNAIHLSGNGEVPLSYTLSQNAQVAVKIYDSSDRLVRTMTAGSQLQGENKMVWDGNDDYGVSAPDGEYYFKVEAVDAESAPVEAATYHIGRVTGVKFTGGSTILMVNGKEVSIADIMEVLG